MRRWTNRLPNMKRLAAVNFTLLVAGMLLGGCLYPDELRKENRIAPQESAAIVQNAVNEYLERYGVLPIKNSTLDTPLYEKYVIDFKKLINAGLISQIPANAFENGGSYVYVLVNPELKPEVKMMDLVALQKAADLQKTVDKYRVMHNGQIPQGEAAGNGWYYIDYDLLGSEPPQIQSVFSGQYLNAVVHQSGKVAIDYAPDIMIIVQRENLSSIDSETDLRSILTEHSYFVPVRSHAYYWHGEPVIAELEP